MSMAIAFMNPFRDGDIESLKNVFCTAGSHLDDLRLRLGTIAGTR
jgi:hypothetical protein